ncbi:MAG: hypothetical protein P8N61_12015 [Porticoccaceae bacterium]|nr:hypothetical protein [Porticoccaceae bacterium]
MSDDQDTSDIGSTKAEHSYYEGLLEELYTVQKNLLHEGQQDSPAETATAELDLTSNDIDEDFDSLEIPILTQSLNREIDLEHATRKIFDEAQHHLFEKGAEGLEPDGNLPVDEEQVNAIVNKLMARLRPKVEQLLRDKIRSKVIERFNQQN